MVLKAMTSTGTAFLFTVAAILARPVGAFMVPSPSSAAAATAAAMTLSGRDIICCGGCAPSLRVASCQSPQSWKHKIHQGKRRSGIGGGRSCFSIILLPIGGLPAMMDDDDDGEAGIDEDGAGDGTAADDAVPADTAAKDQTSTSDESVKAEAFLLLVLKTVVGFISKRWSTILAGTVLVCFIEYGVEGRVVLAPFIPPAEKPTTPADWRSLATIYTVIVTLIATSKAFGMAEDAIALTAANRKEDQASAAASRKEDQVSAAASRKEDQASAAANRKEDQDREDLKEFRDRHERGEDRVERRNDRLEDRVERRNDHLEDRVERRNDRLEDLAERRNDRLDRRYDRLEDVIWALQREKRQAIFLFPRDRRAIDEEIKTFTQRLDKLREKYDPLE